MDFNYSEMQQMLVDSAAKLIADNYTLEHVREQKHIPDGFNPKNWAQFAELGWLALLAPEEAGGLACPFEDAVVLNTMLGKAVAVEPFVSTVVIGGDLIGAMPAQEARDALLSGIVGGDVRIALAHGEPNERYGDGGARTTVATASGNGFLLTGAKMIVLDGASASHLVVSATIENGGLGLFLVAADAANLTSLPYPLIDGTAAADLRLDGVQVDADALIAAGGDADALLARTIDRANLALMAQAVGAMEACNEVCAQYIKEREQFGQPIGRFQALQHMMAEMFVSAHQARSILYQALANIDSDPATRAEAISTAKLLIGEAAQTVSRSAIQLHGGYGVTDEYIVSHFYRRLLTLEKMFGDIDLHTRRLAAAMFDKAA